jgi:hypothetical protein
MTTITYKPPKSVEGYIKSEKFISLIVGPVGSGKTTASIFKILYHAARMKPQEDGVRRSRCVVVRNTMDQLKDTTIPSIQTWFPPEVAHYAKTDKKMLIRLGDVELELLFRALDDADDVRKLLSLEISFAFMDEFREIPSAIYDAIQGRVGRYPSKAKGGCVKEDGSPNHHVFGSTNPPDFGTHWEELLTDPPDNVDVFFQPSGLSADADWTENLIDGYYENLAQGKSQDWVDVYIHAKFGKSLAGMPVFRAFERELHVATGELIPQKMGQGLIIGLDVGLSPAAVIGQVDYQGRVNILEDIVPDERIGMYRFIQEYIKPALAARYGGLSVVIIADPAGQQRSQTDEKTVYEVLRAQGFKVVPARTNAIAARIAAVENFLTRTVDGKPSILIDKRCEHLVKALAGKYRFKTNTKGETSETPEKDHPWSDIADALQYLCLHADGGNTFGAVRTQAKPIEKVKWLYS